MRKYLFALLMVSVSITHALSASPFHVKKSGALLPDTTHTSDTTKADSAVKKRTYSFGLEGANDQSHLGLRNTKPMPYLEPSFTYTAKKGFYIEVSDQYLLIKQHGGFDIFGLNPGWDIDFSDNTTLNFNFQYYHSKKSTPNYVRAGLSSVLETYFDQYIIGELEGRLTIDYDMYKTYKNQTKTPNDIIFTPDLQYTFEWDFGKKSSISVIPEANIDLGTKNIYTIARKASQNDSVNNLKTLKKNYSVSNNSSFGALDYNLILSVEYTVGKFSIEPMVTYTTPLYNSTNLALTKSSPFFLGSITLTYDIESKK